MSRVEMCKCDWCGGKAETVKDGIPEGWDVVDGLGFCDELCAACVAGAGEVLRTVKAARAAGLPFERALFPSIGG